MYHSFLIHSSADGHLGCFHVLAINTAAMNIGVHVSLSILVYLVCISRVGLLGHIQPVYFKQKFSTWRFQGMERPPWQLSITPGLFVMLCRNKYQHTQAWQSSPSVHLLPKTGFLKLVLWVATKDLSTLGLRVLIPILKFSLSLWFLFLFHVLDVNFLSLFFHANISVQLYRMYLHSFPLSFPWDLHIENVKMHHCVVYPTKLLLRPCQSDLIYWLCHLI